MQGRKVVQTEVDATTYTRLKHLADRRAQPLKVVVREALRTYVDREEGRLDQDPIFQLIGRHKMKERDWSTRKDWRP